MKRLSTNEVRQLWLDYFKEKEHYIESSKSLIPVNDNSLLFINSGVATLKKYFDGSEQPPKNRIANSQKSIRTNDIENVGLTSRHHTLFEMLGNFSIGDYFKQEAIDMMFEILFEEKWFDFDLNDFYFTIHPQDEESLNILLAHNVDINRIVKLEENFWEIGEGPGGPNLEIFYDRGQKYDDRDPYILLEQDLENDRVIEIWNIVFSQYNCKPGIVPISEYEELPQKNIDTGMGLERMACILQEVDTNFETDNFMRIIEEVVKLSGFSYEENKMPFRVIADHIRALTFAIADGVIPSNEGRGYVIRRILRRASKYGYINLNLKEPFLYKLVDIVVNVSQPFYDYLLAEQEYVKKVIKQEEVRFLQTLSSGLELLNQEIEKLDSKTLAGDVAFKLYDTYGFPIELTTELLEEQGYSVDIKEFENNLKAQQERARSSIKDNKAMNAQNAFLKEITVDSKFVGYTNLECESKVVFITDLHQSLDTIDQGTTHVILDNCPFYAQSGGQVSDKGFINNNEVVDVIKLPNGQHLLEVVVESPISVGDMVRASVDVDYRNAICKNHSVTHLLHYALQQVLGQNAKQAGSYQDDKRTRFDFSNLEALTIDQLNKIETIVNDMINQSLDVDINEMPIKEAQNMGAMSLFGEKYGDIVRVVKMGDSIELCGGTHVNNTKEIKCFCILSESGIGSGVRRIEGITGDNIKLYYQELVNQFDEEVAKIKEKIANNKKVKIDNLDITYQKLLHIAKLADFDCQEVVNKYDIINIEVKEASTKLKEQASNLISTISQELRQQVEVKDGINYISAKLEDVNGKDLRNIADNLLNDTDADVIVLQSQEDNKVNVIVKCSDNITSKVSAKEVLSQIIEPHNGRGGGKDNMAQGGYNI